MKMRKILRRLSILTVILFFGSVGYFYYIHKQIEPGIFVYTKSAIIQPSESSANYKHITKSLAELGRTPEISSHILFFNRVPKSGSEVLVLLLQWLQRTNNFKYVRLRGGNRKRLYRLEQEQLVDEVTDIIRDKAVPLCFDRYLYFVNFTSFDRQSPTFINLIRDPVEKFATSLTSIHGPKKKWYSRETLEKCVNQKQSECIFKNGTPYDLTIPYFCGQDSRCMLFNDKWALAQAKSNVERYFPVVGVLEELNATLELFEYTIPYFFKGVQDLYYKDVFQPHHNKKRSQVNDDTRNYLQDLFVCEYDFYEWMKRRLFQQLQILNGHNH